MSEQWSDFRHRKSVNIKCNYLINSFFHAYEILGCCAPLKSINALFTLT